MKFTVSDAEPAKAAPPAVSERPAPTKPSDLVDWEPPAEDNDDEPVLAKDDGAKARDWTEITLELGRRDDVKPADVQQLLRDKGIGRSKTRYIRVRDKVTLVSVKNDVKDDALAALSGATLSGKTAVAAIRG